MKKLSLFLSALLISMMSFATTYTHTFKSGELKVGTVTLSGTSWTGAGTVGYWGWDGSKGIQIGSKNNPCKSYSLTTSAFADATITEVVVNTSMASSATAKLSISVGGTSYLSNKALTTSAANYTATGAASGDLVISYTNTARAFYIKSITVTYEAKEIEGPKYTVTANVNNPTMGSVTGAGEYGEGATATLTAIPNPAYKFVDWSNGSTDNPLKITVTENIELTANFEALPTMTCAEASAAANGATVVLNPFDVVYAVKGAGYIYIKDESGVALIFDYTLDDQLKAGDRVEGFVGTSSPYNGLPEIKPSVAFEDLTVTPGTAPEPTLFTEVPTKADINKYVKFENVTLTANATFTTSGASNATMVVNGKNVTLRNNFKLAATLSKDKAYNIVGFAAIYNSTIQVYFLSAEEYVAPEPCTLATPVNWDAPIAAEANTDQWYAVNVKSAIAAGKDLALTVTNPGTEAVEITIEAYADCPATELIVKSTKTFNAGETKTTTVKYDEYLADQVEVVYLHVVTSGDLTIGTEAIEPCSKATPINWDAPITAAANIDAWYAVNVESAIAAGKDLALTVSNPSTEAVEVSIEAYANCPATELIVKSTSTINAGASKTTTVKYDEYLADQVKVVYMHVTTKGGEIKVEAETVKFNVTATAENGTVEGAGVYEQGAEATLTATPAEGYEFVNWTVAGEEVSTENPYKFTVTADVALVANFKKAAPAMETVYFINNKSWSKVNTYAWEPVQNAGWPGKAATKEAEKVAGYDVYSYTAEVGKHKNVIFNNGSSQTADLKWTAGKYYWMGNAKNFAGATKEEAEAALAKPVEYESVYFVNAQGWAKVNIYTWSPEVGTWPGVAMKKEAEQLAGFNVYSYTVEKGTSFGGMLFNNGSGTQTGDLQWTAGKYYVKDGWYTKEEAEAKLAGPVVTVWTMVGDKALFGTDWDLNATANDLVKQEDGSWVLTLTNKTLAAKSYEYKAAKDRAWTTTVPGGDNAKLTISKAGQYDITFTLNAAATSVTAKATYIPAKYNVTVTAENGTVEGAGEYEEGATATLTATANEGYEFVNWTKGEEVVSTENPYTFTVNADVALVANFQEAAPEYEVMELTMTNLSVGSYGDGITGLSASDMDNGIEVMLFLDAEGNLMEESSIMVGWSDYAVTGTVTKAYNEELATDVYTAELYTTVGETNYKLIITMYYVPVEATVVVVENATIDDQTETSGFLYMNGEWTDAEGIVYPVSAEVPGFDATVSEAVYSNVTVTVGGWGDNDPWLGFVQGDATVTVADNVVTLVGTAMSSWDGLVLDVTITGNLPVVEPEVITYELNGGELPAVEVPTNAELWETFKPYYNEYYGLARADQPIDKVSTFANAKMQEIMTDEASEYKWLGDYVQSVATAAGVPLSTDMASANESGWRWAVHAFFNAAAGQYGAAGIDFTEAGKQEVWGAAYEAEYGVVLPTEPVAEDYVLPTPTKEGYTFVGWYDNAEGTGEAYTVIPAGWAGTLYAIWKQDTTTALDNIAVEGKAVKAIINGQLIIIKNGVQYNAQGVILK